MTSIVRQSDDDSTTVAGESFCPSERLTTRIRNILADYPAGVASFKEMLQNADDARARVFKVLYDPKLYPTSRLLSSSLAGLQQAPALITFNDALFSERDFQNILSLGDSAKRDDAATVGKYGLGFNVVYHLSDVVSFVSGDRLVVFDPHGVHLPGGSVGQRYFLAEVLRAAPDSLAPFEAAARALGLSSEAVAALRPADGSSNDSRDAVHFPGTLFRLPLRDEEAAKRSLLCTESLGSATAADHRVRNLLEEFASQSPDMTVFLQHIESIGVYAASEADEPQDPPVHQVGGATVMDVSSELRALRAKVASSRDILKREQVKLAQSQESGEDVAAGTVVDKVTFRLVIRRDPDGFHVTWGVCGGLVVSLVGTAQQLKQLAYASVASPIHVNGGEENASSLEGRLFCGLPLPTRTGLPFHVNAPFALSSNRRDLWFSSRLGDADREGAAGRFARWNEKLLTEGVPDLFQTLLLAVRPASGIVVDGPHGVSGHCSLTVPPVADVAAFYDLMPRLRATEDATFSDVCLAVIRHIVATNAAVFADREDSGVCGDDGSGTLWRGALEVVFLPASFGRRVQNRSVLHKLRQLKFPRRSRGFNCVDAPADLVASLLAAVPHQPEVDSAAKQTSQIAASEEGSSSESEPPVEHNQCPAVLTRDLLSSALRVLAPAPPEVLSHAAGELFSTTEAEELLGWLMEPDDAEDVRGDSIERGAEHIAKRLDGIPLVPLHAGPASQRALGVLRYVVASDSGSGAQCQGKGALASASALYFNPHPHINVDLMLRSFPRLIDAKTRSAARLLELATGKHLNVHSLSPNGIAACLMRFIIPERWCNCRVTPQDDAQADQAVDGDDGQFDDGAVHIQDCAQNAGSKRGKGRQAQPSGGKSGGGRTSGAPRSGGKKDKVKQRELARREQRELKRAGDTFSSGVCVSSSAQELSGVADGTEHVDEGVAKQQMLGKARAIGARKEEVEAVLGRIRLFWLFLEEYPYWHDIDGTLDLWPLIATEQLQLLPRRIALEKRVLRARDLGSDEVPLLRRFGAPMLHESFRNLSRPCCWACVPRREALAALSYAQGNSVVHPSGIDTGSGIALSSHTPVHGFDYEECVTLRQWVRRFAQQEASREDTVASMSDGDQSEDVELLARDLPLDRLLPCLPIFETIGGNSCFALGKAREHWWCVGAPSEEAPFSPTSPWEALLSHDPEWSCRLLSYTHPDARWALKAARAARASNEFFLPLLQITQLDALPQAGAVLYLRGVGQLKPWRHAGSGPHVRVLQTCQTAKLLVWDADDELPRPRCTASQCADPEDTVMAQVSDALAHTIGAELTDDQLPFPPRAYVQDNDVMVALRQAGLRNLSVAETFEAVAARVAQVGSIEAGECLAKFLLQHPAKLVKEWPSVTWMNLRRIAFLPCHDCRGAVPPAVAPGECQRLADAYKAQGRAAASGPGQARPKGVGFGNNRHWRRRSAAVRSSTPDAVDPPEVESDNDETPQGLRKDSETIDLLQRAAQNMSQEPLSDAAGNGKLVLVATDVSMPSDFLYRWHSWEAARFLPKVWEKAPESLKELLFPEVPKDRIVDHIRRLGHRIEKCAAELRGSWRGPILWSLTILREMVRVFPLMEKQDMQFLLTQVQPLIVLESGDVCKVRELCLDLSQDLGVGATRVRAVPSYLRGLRSILVRLGASTASVGAPGVDISVVNPYVGGEAALALLAGAVQDPTLADVVFHFENPEVAFDTEAYGHRLVLGRASDVFRAMVAGPLAVSAARADGRLHVSLPPFVEPAPFAFVLAHVYTGITDDAAAGVGVALKPPSFDAAQFVCSVMQLADHFMLSFLKQWCEVYLSQSELLTVESIVDILTHADGCNADRLFYVCVHQIATLQEAVLQTQQWASIPEALQLRVATEIQRLGRTATRRSR